MKPISGMVAGIGLTVLSCLLLATMDAIGKSLTGRLPVVEVVWARYLFHSILTTSFLAATSGARFMRTRRPVLQLVRGATLLVATMLMYLAFSAIPLADATSVQFAAPIFVTVLSVLVLKERIGIHRIGAVVAGFLGVLLIVQPGFEGTDPHLLLPLAGALVLSVFYLMTRTLADPRESEATLFNTTAVGAVILSIVVLWFWETPSGTDLALMVLIGALGALGHYCLLRGFSYAPASMLSPFLYAQVFFASIFSVFWLGDPLRPALIVGAAVLVASGVYIWWRENR